MLVFLALSLMLVSTITIILYSNYLTSLSKKEILSSQMQVRKTLISLKLDDVKEQELVTSF